MLWCKNKWTLAALLVMGCKPAYRKAGKESESVKSKSVDIIEPKATGLKALLVGKANREKRVVKGNVKGLADNHRACPNIVNWERLGCCINVYGAYDTRIWYMRSDWNGWRSKRRLVQPGRSVNRLSSTVRYDTNWTRSESESVDIIEPKATGLKAGLKAGIRGKDI